ncbi:MAG TPA: RNase adapter RapZ [Cyanobacteria bacterium UBA8530]|nr:RNase adapter RapZ [Cyanobacteria bacterium UBA8530]
MAVRCLEDLGFFCVDNIIPPLLPAFVKLTFPRFNQVAVVMDTRGESFFDEAVSCLDDLRPLGYPFQILFLEASDDVLLKRFNETRRRHPLFGNASLLENIGQERDKLADIRIQADVILDTSSLSPKEFREKIISNFILPEQVTRSLQVTIKSFGYKFGTPMDADLVFDVRFLPNPHYDPSLRPFTGLDKEIQEFVLGHPVTEEFLERFTDLINFLVPHYRREGKTHLAIAIGCTGGRHRSVAIAQYLAKYLQEMGYPTVEQHRDIERQPDYYGAAKNLQ